MGQKRGLGGMRRGCPERRESGREVEGVGGCRGHIGSLKMACMACFEENGGGVAYGGLRKDRLICEGVLILHHEYSN